MKQRKILLGAVCLSLVSLAFLACENDADEELSADKKKTV